MSHLSGHHSDMSRHKIEVKSLKALVRSIEVRRRCRVSESFVVTVMSCHGL